MKQQNTYSHSKMISLKMSEEKEKAKENNTKLVFDDQKKVGEQIVESSRRRI